MSFAEQLKRARIAQGMTQQQVADLMGITNSTYCGYETGKRQPDVSKIKKLASILNTSGDILLETGFNVKKDSLPSIYDRLNNLTDEQLELVKELSLLDEKTREIAVAQIRVLLDHERKNKQ